MQVTSLKGLCCRLRVGEAEELLSRKRADPLPHLPRVFLDRLVNTFLSSSVVDVGVNHDCPVRPSVEIDA